ncbi:MAG TPA: hypothetical protein VJ969_05490 [Desulfopila sp.]|nr:hypothetical protein [Desulfopila sp.]
MNNAWKAALLSALVIPGLGQLFLKSNVRGSIMITTVVLILVALSLKIIGVALAILAEIEKNTAILSAANIVTIGWQAVKSSGGPAFSVLLVILLACWVYSSIDAYLLGNRIDRNRQAPPSSPSTFRS